MAAPYSLMHIARAAATRPVRSAAPYPFLISSAKASVPEAAATAVPVEAYNTIRPGFVLDPLAPRELFPEANRLAPTFREGLPRSNWLRQAEQVHCRAPIRVAKAEGENTFIGARWSST